MPPTSSPPLPPLDPVPWNTRLQGDCLDIARRLPHAIFDFIYMDPPFFTKRDHRSTSRNGDRTPLAFSDRWNAKQATDPPCPLPTGDPALDAYLTWLDLRIRAQYPLLKPTGVFLLHLDWHAVHYAKVLCDRIFGMDHFQNELIWYYQTGGASKARFSRKHDTILLYSKGDTFYFNGKAIAIPRTPKALKRAQCPTGARIKATDTHKNPDDVLLIPALNPMSKERTGYPTQKPLALLTTLLKALCPPNGTIGDLLCGSGTTGQVAADLGLHFALSDLKAPAVP
ncbi:MAG TPA: site-specific DNA-methyltransferase [Verrucomicrobiae bacterium]|nr:site-specific DNA-methyltransferase [Verrucomicrobiae bacterium]HVX83202.1 site-specific DNA-methyltransferase [Phycisphaerae bacterium]